MSALLYEMLRQNDFGDENPKVLVAISRLFPSDQFYYFTEPLWHRWIKRDSAESFAAALDQCEANLRDHRIGAKVAFYVRILRTALWSASGPWIERSLAFLTENQDQIHGELEYEMELNLQLDRYRRLAHLFVGGSPQREKIDRCIREFCTLDEQEAAERLVRTQLELVADSHALLNAVPFDEADYSAAYDALRWIAHATNVRLGIDWPPPDFNKLRDATIRFMREVDSLDDPDAWQWLVSVKAVFELGAICLLAIIGVFLGGLILTVVDDWLRFETTLNLMTLTLVVGLIAPVILYFAVLRKKTTNRWFARWKEQTCPPHNISVIGDFRRCGSCRKLNIRWKTFATPSRLSYGKIPVCSGSVPGCQSFWRGISAWHSTPWHIRMCADFWPSRRNSCWKKEA